MPTEDTNLQPIVRDVPTLLSLGTYQGMTDAEIDSLLDYKISRALVSHEHLNKLAALDFDMEQKIATYQTIHKESQDVLKSMESMNIPWVTISADGTVSQNV